jgi:hypothetical protein
MPTTVLRLRENIALEDLQNVIAELVNLKGCPACGLNGFDLGILVDPAIKYEKFVDRFADVLAGVDDVRATLADVQLQTR